MNDNGATARARNNATKRQQLIEEATFLIRCGVGEAAILHALGYTRNPPALRKRLERAGRHDIIPRIFEWDAQVEEQQRPEQVARKRKEAAA